MQTRMVQIPFGTMLEMLPQSSGTFNVSDAAIDLQYFDIQGHDTRDEKKMYPAMVRVSVVVDAFCRLIVLSQCQFVSRALDGSRFMVKDVADWPDPSLKKQQGESLNDTRRTDLDIYRTDCAQKPKFKMAIKRPSDPDRIPFVAHTSYTDSVINFELKVKHRAFGDTASEFLLPTDEAKKVRGQLYGYPAEVLLHQHRQFYFTVYIFRTSVRIIRWDRVGALVSEPIDLRSEATKLFDFMRRIGDATDSQLGLDPAARAVEEDSAEAQLLKDAIVDFPSEARLKPYVEAAFAGTHWPLYILDVPDKEKPSIMTQFLVRNLRTGSVSPTGRATKGWIALNLTTKRFCFLKDLWRPDSDRIHSELQAYARLSSHGVRGIATVCCGGDLVGQRTQAQSFFLPGVYLARIHTRLALNEVGIPLRDYLDSYELCSVAADAFDGMLSVFCMMLTQY